MLTNFPITNWFCKSTICNINKFKNELYKLEYVSISTVGDRSIRVRGSAPFTSFLFSRANAGEKVVSAIFLCPLLLGPQGTFYYCEIRNNNTALAKLPLYGWDESRIPCFRSSFLLDCPPKNKKKNFQEKKKIRTGIYSKFIRTDLYQHFFS